MIQHIRALALVTVLSSTLLLAGCFDGTRPVWDDQQIGFDVGLNSTPAHSVTFPADEDGSFVEEIQVNLAGPHQPNDVVAVFEINTEETTAVEGVHYNILNPNNAAVIPANSSFGYIEVEVLAGNFEPGESVVLVPRLTDQSDWRVMENYREYSLTLSKEDAPDEEG